MNFVGIIYKKECFCDIGIRGGNKVKKKKWGIITMAAALCLTGCGSSIELNERQNAEAAEYIAGVLLKHSSNYEKSLVYPDNMVEAEGNTEPEVTPASDEKSEASSGTLDGENDTDGTKNGDTIATDKLFATSGFKISCVGKRECSEYTQKNVKSYAIYASKGKKLVVVDVKVKNTSSSNKKINLVNKGINYQLITSDGNSYNTHITAFGNDMNFLSEKVKAGKAKKCVLVFMVPKKTSLKNCQLNISKGSSTATLEIK